MRRPAPVIEKVDEVEEIEEVEEIQDVPYLNEEDYEDEEERRPKKKKGNKRQQMANLRTGLYLISLEWLALGAASASSSIGSGIGQIGALIPDPQGVAIYGLIALGFWGVSALSYLASRILGIIGAIFAMRPPEKTKVRGLAMANMILEISTVGVVFVMIFLAVLGGLFAASRAPAAAGASILLILLAVLVFFGVAIGSVIVFMLFMRGLAKYIRDRTSADEIVQACIFYLGVQILGPVVLIFFVLIAATTKSPIVVLIVAIAGGAMYGWILYMAIMRVRMVVDTIYGRL